MERYSIFVLFFLIIFYSLDLVCGKLYYIIQEFHRKEEKP